MTRKLADLFQSFVSMDSEEQLAKIREVRSARHIERPAAAVKRIKKEGKQKEKKQGDARTLVAKMSPEQRAALIAKLKGETSGS